MIQELKKYQALFDNALANINDTIASGNNLLDKCNCALKINDNSQNLKNFTNDLCKIDTEFQSSYVKTIFLYENIQEDANKITVLIKKYNDQYNEMIENVNNKNIQKNPQEFTY